jgi:hypothetical protein
MECFVFQDVAYVPIWKNATTTFESVIERSPNWKKVPIESLNDSYQMFGHLRDPRERHFKGLTQYIVGNNLEHLLDEPMCKKIFSTAILDAHSYPISSMLGARATRVKWIPMAQGIDTIALTNKYLKSKGIEMDFSTKNQSNSHHIQVYDKLKQINLEFDTFRLLSLLLQGDLDLWASVFPYIDEDNISYPGNE